MTQANFLGFDVNTQLTHDGLTYTVITPEEIVISGALDPDRRYGRDTARAILEILRSICDGVKVSEEIAATILRFDDTCAIERVRVCDGINEYEIIAWSNQTQPEIAATMFCTHTQP